MKTLARQHTCRGSYEQLLPAYMISSKILCANFIYSKTCVKWPLSKRPQIGFQDDLSFNAGQNYCRMLQGEHSALLLTFIKSHLSLRSLFCLFLSGHFRQVLLLQNMLIPLKYNLPRKHSLDMRNSLTLCILGNFVCVFFVC